MLGGLGMVDQIEDPRRATAGLASATQLESTDSALYPAGSSSSATESYVFLPTLPSQESGREAPPLTTRKSRFRSILRQSLRRNKEILDELSRY